MIRRLPASCVDPALLVGRLLIGGLMFAYGWDKLVSRGLAGTAEGFRKNGVPLPMASAAFAGIIELVGGALLILGAATAVVGVLMALEMLGAIVATGQYHAVLAQRGGWALSGSVLAGALILAVVGAGRYSVDHAVVVRTTSAPEARTRPK
jgi:putative oxidoreductase